MTHYKNSRNGHNHGAQMTDSLADFESQGDWDCGHAWDADSHRDAWIALGRPTDPETAISVVRLAWQDFEEADGEAFWHEQNDDEIEGVTPDDAYKAWSRGWQARAVRSVRECLPRWIESSDETL